MDITGRQPSPNPDYNHNYNPKSCSNHIPKRNPNHIPTPNPPFPNPSKNHTLVKVAAAEGKSELIWSDNKANVGRTQAGGKKTSNKKRPNEKKSDRKTSKADNKTESKDNPLADIEFEVICSYIELFFRF